MSDRVNIYRIRLSRGNSSVRHSPDWRLYDDYESFMADLLRFTLEAESRSISSSDRKIKDKLGSRLSRIWHNEKKQIDSQQQLKVQKVLGVDQLAYGRWVELDVELVPPKVILSGVNDASAHT